LCISYKTALVLVRNNVSKPFGIKACIIFIKLICSSNFPHYLRIHFESEILPELQLVFGDI